MLGPSMMLLGAPIAFLASVHAVNQDRHRVASRTALAISCLGCTFVLVILWILFLF